MPLLDTFAQSTGRLCYYFRVCVRVAITRIGGEVEASAPHSAVGELHVETLFSLVHQEWIGCACSMPKELLIIDFVVL